MKPLLKILCPLLLMVLAMPATAAEAEIPNKEQYVKLIEDKLSKVRRQAKVKHVEQSVIPGLYEVLLEDGLFLYATTDASHIMDGTLYRLDDTKLVDVQDERMKPIRADILSQIPKQDMIIFSPKGEPKATAYVFTDVDCGYCQKLHREMAEINQLGVEVRYLAFPRAGAQSGSAKKLVSAWCSEDRNHAMTELKARRTIPEKDCENPVAAQLMLGQNLGVQGTPAIFSADGSLIPGYRPAKVLAKQLGAVSN